MLAAVNVISVISLIYTLRAARLDELAGDLARIDWRWIALGAAGNVIAFFWQAIRWRVLLRPVVRLGLGETARAVFLGLLANEILPLRAGELIRCTLLARNPALPVSVSITSALIERVLDGIWLCAAVAVALQLVPLPGRFGFLVNGAWVLAGLVAALAVVLSFALFRRHHVQAALVGGGWRGQLRVLIDDLEMIGHSRSLFVALLHSIPHLLLQVVPVYCSFRGYGLDLSLSAAFAMMVILRLGTVVPQAPGNLGLFQFLARESLEKIFHVAPAEAARFSLLVWAVVTLPLAAGGVIALLTSGWKWKTLRKAARAGGNDDSKTHSD